MVIVTVQAIRRWFLSGLWRSPDFVRLWLSQTISRFGTQISYLALPLTAVITLDASPIQIGILTALTGVPSLLFGFLLGAWIDRHRRRVILIAVDWTRALVIAIVPIAFFLDFLTLELLYGVAFSMGLLGLTFEVSYRSYLPSLVKKDELVEANGKLELGRSVSEVTGPGIGGGLIQAIGAPVALIADAASFVVSAVLMHTIKRREIEPERPSKTDSLFTDAWLGIKVVWRTRYVRPLILAAGIFTFFSSALEAIFLIYVIDELDVSPGLLGLIFTVGGIGLMLGAGLVSRISAHLGIGFTITTAMLLLAISDLALPLATGSTVVIVIILCIGQFAFGFGLALWNTNQVSLRQASTPENFQGRMNATFQVVVLSALPLGALTGGILGELIPLRTVLYFAVAGEASAVVVLVLSSYLGLKTVSENYEQVPSPSEGGHSGRVRVVPITLSIMI